MDNIQKIDLLLFKSNYCEKIAPHIKFDDDPQQQQQQQGQQENKEEEQQQTAEDSSQDQEQQENVNYDVEEDYVCSRFFFSSYFYDFSF